MGFVNNWPGLVACRFFLGLAEAGLFPGISFYLSCWYKRAELGFRIAIFFSAAAISGSFGGLLAAAIENMSGIGGRPGWAWIFIIEGLATVLFGLASYRFVYDFPSGEKTGFLSPKDKIRAIRRLVDDNQHTTYHEEFHTIYIRQALCDWKMWIGMLIYSGATMPLYAFSMFLPSIIHDLGWDTTVVQSQLLSVPPYILASAVTIFVGYAADKAKRRGIFNIIAGIVGATGFTMLLVSREPVVRYAATILGAIGIYPCIPNTISWTANNVEGVYKRGIVLGFVIGWGNLNGIVSSNIYWNKPHYLEGHAVVLGYMIAFLVGCSLLMSLLLSRENRMRRSGKRDDWTIAKTQLEVKQMGDRRPDFLYTV
jgi:MFS family permease